MPLIPLQPQEQQPQLLDSGGNRTLRTPNLPGPSGAWGQALGNVSQGLGQLHAKMVEANDTRHLIEAEGDMRGALAEQMKFQQENIEERDWLPNWQKTTERLQKSFGDRPLSDAARLRLTQTFGRFSDNQSLEIQGLAFKQAVNRSRQAVVNRMDEAARSGDSRGVESAAKLMLPGAMLPEDQEALVTHYQDKAKAQGIEILKNQVDASLDNRDIGGAKFLVENSDLLRPDEKDAQLARITAVHETNAEKDQFRELSLKDPKAAAAELDDPKKFPRLLGADRAEALIAANQIQAKYAADAFRDLKTRIDLGQVKPDEKFEGPGTEQLTPIMRDVLKAANAQRASIASQNNPEAFHKAEAAIESYKPSAGDDLKRADFEAYLETAFSGPYKESLKSRWKEKVDSKATDITETGEAFKSLNRWAFDDQRMGQFKMPAVDEKGAPILKKKDGGYLREKSWLWGENFIERPDTYEPVMKEDPKKLDEVSTKVASIKETIRREVKDGTLKDSAAVMRRLAELAKMPLSAAAAQEASGAPNPLLPALDTPKIDLNAILDRYAPNR